MSPKASPFIAVICPTFNSRHFLSDYLESFRKQTYKNFKIYFVDDGSTDESASFLQSVSAGNDISIDVQCHGENLGAAAARNTAISKALSDGAELFVLMDVDCRVQERTLFQHVHAHYQHPECLMIGGAIQGQAQSRIGIADGFGSWFTGIPFSKSGYINRLHLSSTNLSLKRGAFTSVGLFDEELKTGEDVAYCRRFQKLKLPIWFQSDLIVKHLDRNDKEQARRHHYRWGLHSYTLSQRAHGGYFGVLNRIPGGFLPLCLVPLFAFLHTFLIVSRFVSHQPKVLFYIPWLFYLKWWNSVGVYHGFRNPNLCRYPKRRRFSLPLCS